MQRFLGLLFMTVLLWTTAVYSTPMDMQPYKGSAEFEKLKGLIGQWEGKQIQGAENETPVAVEYSLTSNGSALVEKLMAGTPHEMVTIYHDKQGRAALNHYCALGNQPQMDLVSATGNTLVFELSPASDIDVAKEDHMHGLTLEFDDTHLKQSWTFYQNGQPVGMHVFEFSR